MPFSHSPIHLKRKQLGVALIMSLVFLTLLTILGLTSMSTTILQEKMAANMKDKNLAFQAAETGLRTAEQWVNVQLSKPVFPNNASGLYLPSTTAVPIWDSLDWTATANLVVYPNTPSGSGVGSLATVGTLPKYIIEDMGEEQDGSLVLPKDYKGVGKTVLRITARGTGGTDSAQVMVQSTFARPF